MSLSYHRRIPSWLKSLSRVALVALVLLSTGCIKDEKFTHENTTIISVGQSAPDFEVTLLDGATRRLSDFKGDVVMLIFFSAECPDCHAQFAEIQRQISQFVPKFNILAISRGDSTELVEEFKDKYCLDFEVGLDPERSIYSLYASRYVPRCFLIGQDGKVKSLTVEYRLEDFTAIWQVAEQMCR